jgi:hypothetical protein
MAQTNNGIATNSLWEQLSSMLGMGSGNGATAFPAGDTAAGMTIGNVPGTNAGVVPPTAGSGLGMNIGTGQLALGGLAALGNLWGASKAQGLAEDQFDFTKKITNTNLNNQIKSYNTALADRIRSRTATEGGSQQDAEAYLQKNSLSR